VWGLGLAISHRTIEPTLGALAADVAISGALAWASVPVIRGIRRRLPTLVVSSDHIEAIPAGSIGTIALSDITSTRWTTERYGVGSWNEARILWLIIDGNETPIGRDWANHQRLQDDIVSRVAASDALKRPPIAGRPS